MTRPSQSQIPTDGAAASGSQCWLAAGAASIVIAIAANLISAQLLGAADALAAAIGIAGGCAALWALEPRAAIRRLSRDLRPELRDLNAKLQRIAQGDRSVSLRDLIIDRDDDLGELSQRIHELAAGAASVRLHSRLLHRKLDHQVKRETRRVTADLERQAATDPLTGLGNRRALEHWLQTAIGDHNATLLSIMAIDLDLFKEVNDTLGHEAGDRCLKFLGELLRASVRGADCAIRLGGDEFLLLMPDCAIEQASAAAARLASMFEQMPWTDTRIARPTLSIGIGSGHVRSPADAAELIRDADAALYECKQQRHRARRSAA